MGLQVVGLVLGLTSWCLQSSCTSSQVWRTRSQLESVSSTQWFFEGLWMSCAATSLGSVQCNRFKTVLGLPGETPACPGSGETLYLQVNVPHLQLGPHF